MAEVARYDSPVQNTRQIDRSHFTSCVTEGMTVNNGADWVRRSVIRIYCSNGRSKDLDGGVDDQSELIHVAFRLILAGVMPSVTA